MGRGKQLDSKSILFKTKFPETPVKNPLPESFYSFQKNNFKDWRENFLSLSKNDLRSFKEISSEKVLKDLAFQKFYKKLMFPYFDIFEKEISSELTEKLFFLSFKRMVDNLLKELESGSSPEIRAKFCIVNPITEILFEAEAYEIDSFHTKHSIGVALGELKGDAIEQTKEQLRQIIFLNEIRGKNSSASVDQNVSSPNTEFARYFFEDSVFDIEEYRIKSLYAQKEMFTSQYENSSTSQLNKFKDNYNFIISHLEYFPFWDYAKKLTKENYKQKIKPIEDYKQWAETYGLEAYHNYSKLTFSASICGEDVSTLVDISKPFDKEKTKDQIKQLFEQQAKDVEKFLNNIKPLFSEDPDLLSKYEETLKEKPEVIKNFQGDDLLKVITGFHSWIEAYDPKEKHPRRNALEKIIENIRYQVYLAKGYLP